MKVPESLPKLLQAVKWSYRDDVAQVSCADYANFLADKQDGANSGYVTDNAFGL